MFPDNRASSNTIQAAPERVWAVMPSVYEALNIPVGTLDRTTRVIGNRRIESRSGRIAGERASSYLNCGNTAIGPSIADSYQVNLSVLTQIVPAPGGTTQVQTFMDASATRHGVSGGPVRCASTGRLELQIAEAIQQQLQSR
jgi:hypothetical protein